MLRACPGAEYTGYDVFDSMNRDFHTMVYNGKRVTSKQQIEMLISPHTDRYSLHQGMTQHTLWNNPICADFVFVDGDHRVSAIQSDFDAVKSSKIVALDDFYLESHEAYPRIDQIGCNTLVQQLGNCVLTPDVSDPKEQIKIAFWSDDQKTLDIIHSLLYNS